MGWCHEFGVDIDERCDHPMVAATDSCRCEACGAVCEGRFKGCARVWERGPIVLDITRPPRDGSRGGRATTGAPAASSAELARSNGRGTPDASARPAVRHSGTVTDTEADTELIATIEGIRAELRGLTAVLEEAPRHREERLMVLALDLPRRVEAALVETIESGDSTDLDRLEELRTLVATTREALYWRASDHDEEAHAPGAPLTTSERAPR